MEIIIVRHGDPNYALDTLTRKGKREAKLLAAQLSKENVAEFYCSPLGRAQKTASYTLKKMKRKAETLDFLREFEGRVKENGIKTVCWDRKPSEWVGEDDYYSFEKWHTTPLMKEYNVYSEYKKVCDGIDALLEKHGYVHKGRFFEAVKPNNDKIVFFCHFGVEAVILSNLFSVSPMIFWHNFVALPTSVTRIVTEEREKGTAVFRCISFGDLGHLRYFGEKPSFQARFCERFEDETRH